MSVHSPFFPCSAFLARFSSCRLIFRVSCSFSLSFLSLLTRPGSLRLFRARTYSPSLHRAITNCSTKVSRNKRYMRWRKGFGKANGAENDMGWTTLSESTMGTILRLVGRHLPLTTTRHLQKLTRMSGREVAAATEHSADFRIFREDTKHGRNVANRLVLLAKLRIWV